MKNFIVIILGVAIILSLSFVHPVQAVGFAPFGGRLAYFSPPIITGIVNCPPIAVIANVGGIQKGPLFLMLPPSQPKLNYNFFTPGVAVMGNYVPVPLPFNCPLQPIYHSVIFGTSLR